jgi:DNA (cytosine-5)-methyltransferase 1
MKALGCYIFAGGFSIGVKKAGFTLLGHLENGPFGAETARHNLKIPVWEKPNEWPVDRFIQKVDWLYGNPPCSGWSYAGTKTGIKESERWRDHSQTVHTLRLFSLSKAIQPRVFTWESVAAVKTKAVEFITDQNQEMIKQGYHIYHVLLDGVNCGLPQHRRRFFFIASRVRLNITRPHERWVTVGEVLKDVIDPGPYLRCSQTARRIVQQMPRNKTLGLRRYFDEHHTPKELSYDKQGRIIGRPTFLSLRVSLNDVSPTITGGCQYYHPFKPRHLSVLEQQLICGYPRTFRFMDPVLHRQYAEIGKAVLPPPAYWLGRIVYGGLMANVKIKPGLTEYNFLKKED